MIQGKLSSFVKFSAFVCFTIICILFISSSAYAATYGVVTGTRVNVRASAEINDSNRIFQVLQGTEIELTGTDGDFFRANINDYENVYISRDWVRITRTYVTTWTTIMAYNAPVQHEGVAILPISSFITVPVTSMYENWFGVIVNDQKVFVENTQISIPYFVELPTSRIPGSATLADEIIEFARQYLGTRYIFGGTTPNGFDCSGFVMYILRNFDIHVNRTSRDQVLNGVHVYRRDLIPGDLVFFGASPGSTRITHVGMYIGDGSFIHSSSWNTGVIISSMYSAYNNPRFIAARRVIDI